MVMKRALCDINAGKNISQASRLGTLIVNFMIGQL
jgi:hypothetical protein